MPATAAELPVQDRLPRPPFSELILLESASDYERATYQRTQPPARRLRLDERRTIVES